MRGVLALVLVGEQVEEADQHVGEVGLVDMRGRFPVLFVEDF